MWGLPVSFSIFEKYISEIWMNLKKSVPGLSNTHYWNLHHERVNALLLIYIHRDIFLDFDEIIDIYASKYSKRMLLINLLSQN